MAYPKAEATTQIETMSNRELVQAFDKKSGQVKQIRWYLEKFGLDLEREQREQKAIYDEIMKRNI